MSQDEFVLSADFFALLKELETNELRFGRSDGPSKEPARLGQSLRMSFAASDIAGYEVNAERGTVPEVHVNAIGLFGPEGPMPLHITRWMLARASNRWFASDRGGATSDKSFLDFCNMLQNRMIAFYWRAWADLQADVQIQWGKGGPVTAMIHAFAGLGMPGTTSGPDERREAKLKHATSLTAQVHSPERLTQYLQDAIGTPVSLREFVGVWTPLPTRLQSRISLQGTRLHKDTVVGKRIFERQSRAEIIVGPLTRRAYSAFLTDHDRRRELKHALLFACGHEIAFDLRLSLAIEDVPEPRLKDMQLGRLSWLGRPRRAAADDFRCRNFTARQSERTAA